MMDDVYENIHDYNLNRKRKILIIFDDMIADIMTNKIFSGIIKELFNCSIGKPKEKETNKRNRRNLYSSRKNTTNY